MKQPKKILTSERKSLACSNKTIGGKIWEEDEEEEEPQKQEKRN